MNPHDPRHVADARKRARRTALWLALVALAVFVGFLAMGAMGR